MCLSMSFCHGHFIKQLVWIDVVVSRMDFDSHLMMRLSLHSDFRIIANPIFFVIEITIYIDVRSSLKSESIIRLVIKYISTFHDPLVEKSNVCPRYLNPRFVWARYRIVHLGNRCLSPLRLRLRLRLRSDRQRLSRWTMRYLAHTRISDLNISGHSTFLTRGT